MRAYPWLLAVVAAAGVVYVIDREHQRRAAVAAARAHWEHQAVAERDMPTSKRSFWPRVAGLPTEPTRAH